jgi:iron uptake system EfeUOB component EfeO/EfeM
MEKMDIFALVDELQEEIEMSPTQGFSKNKSVDAKIVLEIISDIKNVLHEELDASRMIMSERDQIISAAESQASEIIKRAKKDADELIKKEEVYKAAYERAAKLLENSKQKAQELRKSANAYAEEVFDELEGFYRESIDMVKVNKTRLYGKSEPTITPKSEGEVS